jgi:hypothetical protein
MIISSHYLKIQCYESIWKELLHPKKWFPEAIPLGVEDREVRDGESLERIIKFYSNQNFAKEKSWKALSEQLS